jgi:hypothetical protein
MAWLVRCGDSLTLLPGTTLGRLPASTMVAMARTARQAAEAEAYEMARHPVRRASPVRARRPGQVV